MKKLLGAALALTMSITCAGALAACDSCGAENGGGNDAEVAKKAISSINVMYADKATETPSDYTVLGQTKVDGNTYSVTWSVSSATFNDLDSYVKIGTEMNDKKEYTVSVTKAEEAIEYKLKASVTVGEATESVEFNRKVPAKPHESAGTLEDPYTPSYAKDLASKLEIAERYAETDDIPLVYIRGYVVDCGKDSGTRAGFVYIADSYADDKGQNSTDAIMILSINYGDVLTKFGDLGKGDLITVSGFLMNYRKGGATGTGDPQPELTYKGSTGIQCHALVKAEDKRTDAEKVADALEGVNATMTVNKTGDTTLPVSEETDVTFSWALKSGDAATVAEGKLTVTALPTEDKTVVVTVTASCGTVTETKDVTVTVKAATPVTGGVKFDFSTLTATTGVKLNADTALELFNKTCNADSGLVSVAVENVYDGTGTGGGKPNAAGIVKMGTGKLNGKIDLTFGTAVTKIEIKCHDFYNLSAANPTNKNTLSVNGSDARLAPYNENGDGEVMTFELTTAATTVSIESNLRVYLYEIVVYFAA